MFANASAFDELWGTLVLIVIFGGAALVAVLFVLSIVLFLLGHFLKLFSFLLPQSAPKHEHGDRPEIQQIEFARHSYYRWICGAYPTTLKNVRRFFSRFGGLKMWFAGVQWPLAMFSNKFVLITAGPGAGKTATVRLMMREDAKLFQAPGIRLRWFVTDPTGAFLKLLYQTLPSNVPILRISPQDIDGLALDFCAEVGQDRQLVKTIVGCIFNDSDANSNDRFWTDLARELVERILLAFLEFGGTWRLADLTRMFAQPEFIRPFLAASTESRGWAAEVLNDKIGHSIITTAARQINKLQMAAACMEHARAEYRISGPTGFLHQNCVAHLESMPQNLEALALFSTVVTNIAIYHACERQRDHNYTIFWVDEGRFAGHLPIEVINAVGRAYGLGVRLTAVGIPALEAAWGAKRVKELIDGVHLWMCMTCGKETADGYSKHVGDMTYVERITDENYTKRPEGFWLSLYNLVCTNGDYGPVTVSSKTSVQNQPRVNPAVVTGLPQAGNNQIHSRVFCKDTGEFEAMFPFMQAFENLPPSPVEKITQRPPEQRILRRFNLDDFRRLQVPLSPELEKLLDR